MNRRYYDRNTHTHPCVTCHKAVACDNDNLEENYDGWPEVVCLAFNPDPNNWRCEDCQDKCCPTCDQPFEPCGGCPAQSVCSCHDCPDEVAAVELGG